MKIEPNPESCRRISALKILGIVNITEDSFSDGGRYLDPLRAIEQSLQLVTDGACAIDLGPASSHPRAKPVTAEEEIGRLAPVVKRLKTDDVPVSIDSPKTETQRWALDQGVDYLNDICGFPAPAFYSELAQSRCRLILMHSISRNTKAERVVTDAASILDRIEDFFGARIAALEDAGVRRDRMVLDPGMGFFLGSNPEPSLAVLAGVSRLKNRFGLPILLSVSRKSFLRTLTGREIAELGPATLAAEIHCAIAGVDYIRTHDVRALSDALKVLAPLY